MGLPTFYIFRDDLRRGIRKTECLGFFCLGKRETRGLAEKQMKIIGAIMERVHFQKGSRSDYLRNAFLAWQRGESVEEHG